MDLNNYTVKTKIFFTHRSHDRSRGTDASGREHPVQRRLHPGRGHCSVRGPVHLHEEPAEDTGLEAHRHLSRPRECC